MTPPLDDASLSVTAMATDHIFAQASHRAYEIRVGTQQEQPDATTQDKLIALMGRQP